MNLEDFEAHLNELLHDLSSPLGSMRLQLGLLREAVKTQERLTKRVESAERQVVRSQIIIDSFVAAVAVKSGRSDIVPVVRRVFERFGIDVDCETKESWVALDDDTLTMLVRSFAEGCARQMEEGTSRAHVSAGDDGLVIKVQGRFETGTTARALRLSYTNPDGEPDLSLARTRLTAAAALGALVLEEDALVLRLPLLTE